MVKRQLVLLGSCLMLATHLVRGQSPAPSCAAGDCRSELVYVGTHGWDPQHSAPPVTSAAVSATPAAAAGTSAATEADAQGIYAARLDTSSGHLEPLGLVAQILRANWLTNHPTLPILYCVGMPGTDMHAEALIYSLEVDRASGKLRVINQAGSGVRMQRTWTLMRPQ